MEKTKEKDHIYIAIDLKSFYASVECRERGLDPLTTNLVVADVTRTEKTICLAVSPSLKAYGIPGRPRLFEVVQAVKEVNVRRKERYRRQRRDPRAEFLGKSTSSLVLEAHPDYELDYIAAPPQMARYMEISTRIYEIYLRYVAPEDIHVYSIDEVFMDVTAYLHAFHHNPHEMAMTMIHDVLRETGITATAGIGTNMYLAKVAMDIVAKHIPADADGVRIAELDQRSYREKLWNHTPLTDFWRIGGGIARRLYKNGMHTMGDVALMAVQNEEWFFREFGVNGEFLMDHAFGYEPVSIPEIKKYKPETKSVSQGQVLSCAYEANKGRLVAMEMAETLALDLVRKHLTAGGVVLSVGYDIDNLSDPTRLQNYAGPIVYDFYGRPMPKMAHGTESLGRQTNSNREIVSAIARLYDRIVNDGLLIRRMYVVADRIRPEGEEDANTLKQLSFFDREVSGVIEPEDEKLREVKAEIEKRNRDQAKDKAVQEAILKLQMKYGKNAVLKGMNLEEGATQMTRNNQIGGHRK